MAPAPFSQPRGFLNGELRRGVGFEPLIRNRDAASDRASVGPLPEPALGPVEGRQAVSQAGRNGVITLLVGKRLSRVGPVTGLVRRVPAGSTRLHCLPQQVLNPGPLGLKQRPCSFVVHVRGWGDGRSTAPPPRSGRPAGSGRRR